MQPYKLMQSVRWRIEIKFIVKINNTNKINMIKINESLKICLYTYKIKT